METYGFNVTGIDEKMPMMGIELHLNQNCIKAIEDLFSLYRSDFLLGQSYSRVDTIEEETNGKIKKDSVKNTRLLVRSNAARAATLKQIKVVRNLLDDRDLDFRFWFFEASIIEAREDMAYHKNHNYSVNQLSDEILKIIHETQEFKDFKSRKTKQIKDTKKIGNYFSVKDLFLRQEILLQIHRTRFLSKSNEDTLRYKSDADRIIEESLRLGVKLSLDEK